MDANCNMATSNTSYKNLEQFKKEHLIAKDDQTTELTHTELGQNARRRLHIPDEHYDTFMKLYYQDILKRDQKEFLIERQLILKQQDAGIHLLDIDFQFLAECTTRQYTQEHIQDIITIVLNLFSTTFEQDEDLKFTITVLEKPSPRVVTKSSGQAIVKDGIHFMFSLRMDPIYHQYFRYKLIETLSHMHRWTDLPIINKGGLEDVIDLAISGGSNGWLPPNSQKPDDTCSYKVSRAFMCNYDTDRNEWNQVPLVERPEQVPAFYAQYYKNLFVRNKNLPKMSLEKEDAAPLLDQFRNQHTKPTNHTTAASSPNGLAGQSGNAFGLQTGGDEQYQIPLQVIRQITNQEQLETLRDIFLDNIPQTQYALREAYDYVMSLPEQYYDSGSYLKWIKVGFALRNTNVYLLIAWAVFSAQSSTFDFHKHIPELCDFWEKFNHRPIDGVTSLSLMYWSKTDAPEKYVKIREKTIDFLIDQSLQGLSLDQLNAKSKSKGACTDYDIAYVVLQMKKGIHVSCGIKSNMWYYFNGVYWSKDDSGTILRKTLSTELRRLYSDKARRLADKAFQITTPDGDVDVDNEEHIMLKARATMLNAVATRLGNMHDKDCIMRECRELFYDKEFEQKLDQNRYLLCCKNGVIDFKERRFRKAAPEDYLSKCTQLDYRPLDPVLDKESVEEIKDYFHKLFPIEEVYNYMWDHLATIIIGDTAKTQCLHYYTGEGQNGKSMLIKLLELILGDYATPLDVSFFVNERPSRGKATPELVSLIGARLAVTSEPTEGERLNEGPMKQLTSGTDKITYRGLFKDQESFIPQAHSIIMSNHYLPVKSRDHGTWRRIRVVKFLSLFTDNPVDDDPEKPYQFKKQSGFEDKFKIWAPVLMAMLVNIAFENQGALPICDIIREYSKEYQKGQDFIMEFIEDRMSVGGPNDLVKKAQISSLFNAWYYEMYSTKISGKTQELFNAIEKHFRVTYKDGWRGICVRRDVQEIPVEQPDDSHSEIDDDQSTTSTITPKYGMPQ